MPSPSKLALISGLVITGAIFYGGAWFASGLTSAEAAPENADNTAREMPLLAPVPGLIMDASGQTESETRSEEPAAETRPSSINELPPENETAGADLIGPLRVSISGVRNSNGNVLILIFDDKAAYDAYAYEDAVGFAQIKATTENIFYSFEDLTSGPYAVTFFHDENENNDLDMQNGYPIEGYGSSGAKSAYDEPSFAQAAIGPGDVSLKMHYLE